MDLKEIKNYMVKQLNELDDSYVKSDIKSFIICTIDLKNDSTKDEIKEIVSNDKTFIMDVLTTIGADMDSESQDIAAREYSSLENDPDIINALTNAVEKSLKGMRRASKNSAVTEAIDCCDNKIQNCESEEQKQEYVELKHWLEKFSQQ